MQIGDVIKGTASEPAGYAYLITRALGVPGLFGQALLGRRTDTDQEVVLKTMRADRPADDRERFFHEGRTLERVAACEDQAGKHYAVRLLDQSPPDAPEIFLVLERADGQNVLEDLLEPIVDWPGAPLDEQLALEIAWHFAQALRLAHHAGICYDDMKLDNLFWNAARPDDPLRVIDWNVTSSVAERGVAGDWARFGARLYELRTGQRIGVSHDGTVLGAGPAGPAWQALPEGLRDIVEQALGLRYTDDEGLLRDLKREREQARWPWHDLIERATIADGSGQTIDVLAPVWRAERQLQALPPDDAERAAGLATCADLRQRAVVRRGVASARALDSALQSLARNEPRLAIERFQKAYNETGARDPRPRRWLWVAQLAAEQADRYRAVRANLDAGVDALNRGDLPGACEHLAQVCAADSELESAGWLLAEAAALAQAAANPAAASEALERLRDLFDQFADLKALRLDLQLRAAAQQRLEQALQREQELWDSAQAALAAATHDEQSEAFEAAMRQSERALAALQQLLQRGCTPEREPAVRAARDAANTQLDRLNRHVQIAQIPALAASPDPRQRQLALARATQLVPGWVELPRLRKQIRQIEACFEAISRAEPLLPSIDQALAAIDALDRVGIKLDLAGAELRLAQRELAEQRAELADRHAREQIQAARAMIDEARQLLSRGRCDDALALLRQTEAQPRSAATHADLERALQEADGLLHLLQRVAEERAVIDAALGTGDLIAACRDAQRLARVYPQLPVLAEEAAELELTFWQQLVAMAQRLAIEFQQLSLQQSTRAAVRDLEERCAALLAQRGSGEQLAALAAAAHTSLRGAVERACADLAEAQSQWHRRRADTIAELQAWLHQAERAVERADHATARGVLDEIRAGYLPADAYEQGLDTILARIDRLDGTLAEHRDEMLASLRDLERRLSQPDALVWHEELAELARAYPDDLDPAVQSAWEQVRDRADRLRQDAERVQRRDLATINQSLVQLDQGAHAVAQASEQLAKRFELQFAALGEALRHGQETSTYQLALLEKADRHASETLVMLQKWFTRVMAGLSLIVIVFIVFSIMVTR